MSEQELHLRTNSAALSMTKKLSKRTVSKQTAEQSVKNDDQLSVQSLISFKMSKQLMQFFVNEFSKTSDSFKIKLEVLTFNRFKVNSENEDEISDEIKEVLKIIKKQVKNFIKKSVKSHKDFTSYSSSSDSSSNSDESDH